jgi:hypothetical protein
MSRSSRGEEIVNRSAVVECSGRHSFESGPRDDGDGGGKFEGLSECEGHLERDAEKKHSSEMEMPTSIREAPKICVAADFMSST